MFFMSIINEMDIIKPEKGINPAVEYKCPKCGSNNVIIKENNLYYKFYKCNDCDFLIG